jgi:hypothetical protein
MSNSNHLQFEFTPNSKIVIPNQLKKPQKVTVTFDGKESFTTTLIMGAEISIQCAERPPEITFSDVE